MPLLLRGPKKIEKYEREQEPSLIACKRRRGSSRSCRDDRGDRLGLPKPQRRPKKDSQRSQEDCFRHRRRLKVEQVGIRSEEKNRSYSRGDRLERSSRRRKHGKARHDEREGGRNTPSQPGPPETIAPHQRQHKKMWQRKPHRPQLLRPRRSRID